MGAKAGKHASGSATWRKKRLKLPRNENQQTPRLPVKLETQKLKLTKRRRSNKHWQAKINAHLRHQYSIRINAKF